MIYQKRCDTENTVDVSEDFVLPDYCPEVRRVLGVTARASVGGKYLSGEELEADGDVTYTVVYMGGRGKYAKAAGPRRTRGIFRSKPRRATDSLRGI